MKKFKILIADDEKEIREILSLILSGEGYEVVCAKDGLEAVQLADAGVDLFLLDVGMPGLNGFAAAGQIRQISTAPIIFLTAYSGETDKVMGFAAGADDYIVKPFSNIELLMRIKAVLRRSSGSLKAVEEKLYIRDLVLDPESQMASIDGRIIVLTYTEFKILELLARHKKKIYSIENLYESIWDDAAVGDSAIMVHIKNIRKKLGDNSRNPKYIKTAWGKGYYVDE